MIESFASFAPTRSLEWLREQRQGARRAFADTEWADTEASVFVDDPLAPPAPMHVLAAVAVQDLTPSARRRWR